MPAWRALIFVAVCAAASAKMAPGPGGQKGGMKARHVSHMEEMMDQPQRWVCPKGTDPTTELMLTQAFESTEHAAFLSMGTGNANEEITPETCLDGVRELFCRYNAEFRDPPTPATPALPRNCPLLASPQFRLDYTEPPETKCGLRKTPDARSARIGYVIMAKQDSKAKVQRLLSAIDHPNNLYVVHVDLKAGNKEISEIQASVPDSMRERVKVISSRRVHWGGASILLAHVDGLKHLHNMSSAQDCTAPSIIAGVTPDTNNGTTGSTNTTSASSSSSRHGTECTGGLDYYINLSESDYPIMTQNALQQFLGEYAVAQGISFIDFTEESHKGPLPVPPWAHTGAGPGPGLASQLTERMIRSKLQRVLGIVYECEEDGKVYATNSLRRVADHSDFRGGSFWTALHRDLVDVIVGGNCSVEGGDVELAAKLLDFFSVTSNPDESFFQTLAVNSRACDRICNSNLRFENWKVESNPDLQHPLPMDTDDVDLAMRTGMAFARKFDSSPVYNYVDGLLASKKFKEATYGKQQS